MNKIFLVFFMISSPALAKKIELKVNEFSTVTAGADVTLGDVLGDVSNSFRLPDHMFNAVIADSLNSEREESLESSQVAIRLRQTLSFQDLQNYSIVFPASAKVRARRNYISSIKFQREILKSAEKFCSGCDVVLEKFQFDNEGLKGELLGTQLQLENLRGGGSFAIPLQIQTSQGRVQKMLNGNISFFKAGLVAKRLISAGTQIGPEDFERQNVNVTFSKDSLTNFEDLNGKVLNKTLAMGQALFKADLKKELVAFRGQNVKIIIEGENFEISANGLVEQNGAPGDLIAVKNLNSNKSVTAMVVEKGVVKLQ